MTVFNEKQEELEHFETRMGVPADARRHMDLVTDAMALVGNMASIARASAGRASRSWMCNSS